MGDTAQLFDVILVADCLFFKACHDALVWTLRHSLAPRGTVYVFYYFLFLFVCDASVSLSSICSCPSAYIL